MTTRARQPPSDAVILFDGASLAAWRTAQGETPKWKVENSYMEVVKGAGDILTREEFGDSQLRVEWRTPTPPSGDNQERGNSGVFLFGLYEVQVLDKFRQQASAIYGQTPPLRNVFRPPGVRQSLRHRI